MKNMARRIANALISGTLEQKHFVPDIKLEVRRNYGTNHMYVTSPEHAEAIAALTGKKTVTEKDIQALKALGFHVYRQEKKAEL